MFRATDQCLENKHSKEEEVTQGTSLQSDEAEELTKLSQGYYSFLGTEAEQVQKTSFKEMAKMQRSGLQDQFSKYFYMKSDSEQSSDLSINID